MDATSVMRRCPYCGEKIALVDCPIVATNFPLAEVGDLEGLSLEDVELPSSTGPIRLLPKTHWPVVAEAPRTPSRKRSFLDEVLGTDFRGGQGSSQLRRLIGERVHDEDLPARACPACEYPLPRSIDHRHAAVIAVVGVNRVGKTHLLATSLTEGYHGNGLASLGCSEFVPDDNTAERFRFDYYEPLFRRGERLEKTQSADEEARFKPLVFDVTFQGIPFSLVMHDVAGEALGNPHRRASTARYLRAAVGIIFVVDPRDIEGLRTGMPDWILEDPENELTWDQGALLSACLRADGVLADRSIPVAVTIAKADLLPRAVRGAEPLLARAPSPETREAFIERVRTSSRAVEDFLERCRAESILRPAREYARRIAGSPKARVTYHAVSALGTQPGEGGSAIKVEPVNCLDPLATILIQITAAQ